MSRPSRKGALGLPCALWLACACGSQIPERGTQAPGAAGAAAGTGATPSSNVGDNPGQQPGAAAGGGAQPTAGLNGSGAQPAAFACDESVTREPEQLRRLTMTQYRHTVRDLVRWALPDPVQAADVIERAALDAMPEDRREPLPQDPHGSYRRLDQALEQVHVDAAYRVGVALGAALSEPTHLSQVAGACATDADASNDEACLTAFIERFGERALRHPIDADEAAFYRSVYGPDPLALPSAYADVITVMLSSPHFLYFVEHGERLAPGSPGVYELSPYELASRLSYHFWQTLPDDELWTAAQDGSLLDDAVYTRQVERLAGDERERETMREFFADWLKVEETPAFGETEPDALYTAFAGADLPSPALRGQMIDDVLDMVEYYTFTDPSGVDDLLTSERSFARGEELAGLYGVAAWDGVSEPPPLPPGQRPGLLTRARFVANGSANTRPILKGVFIRRSLLCDTIPPPPAGANAIQPMLRPDMTTRQVVSEMTEQPGTQCAGCHAVLINPLGFATEGFDALGRFRAEQHLFDAEGNAVGNLPVDTTSVPRITPDDERVSSGPADLNALILESGKLEACLARNYFRFTYGRLEDSAQDGCALERMRARLVDSGRITELLKEAALSPEFRQRAFGVGE